MSKFACPVSGFTIPEIEPRLFSFNNPAGACPACDGLGQQLEFDEDLIVPDRDKSLQDGAIAPWSRGTSPLYTQTLQAIARHHKAAMAMRWRDLPKSVQNVILHGSGDDQIKFVYDDGVRRYEPRKRSKASSPISNGAGARPIARGCAKNSANTNPPPHARRARAAA